MSFEFPEKEFPEAGRERLVKSFRERFKKAVAATVLPIAFTAAIVVSTPEKIGFKKEDVSKMLNSQTQISSYIEAANLTYKEGEMEPEERQITAKAAQEGTVIKNQVGEENLNGMIDTVPLNPESKKEPTLIKEERDFEKINLDIEILKSALNKLPEKWRKNIRSVSCDTKAVEKSYVKEKYGIENGIVVAQAKRDCSIGLTDITFFKSLDKWAEDEIREILTHEAGHANDWRNHDKSIPQRINMLYETMKRTQSSDRFRSWYVESIKIADKHRELATKSTEYWAEIVSAYFTDKKLPSPDKEMVEKFK
jgi:hypothetical protein